MNSTTRLRSSAETLGQTKAAERFTSTRPVHTLTNMSTSKDLRAAIRKALAASSVQENTCESPLRLTENVLRHTEVELWDAGQKARFRVSMERAGTAFFAQTYGLQLVTPFTATEESSLVASEIVTQEQVDYTAATFEQEMNEEWAAGTSFAERAKVDPPLAPTKAMSASSLADEQAPESSAEAASAGGTATNTPARGAQTKTPHRTAMRPASQKCDQRTQWEMGDTQNATGAHTAAVRTLRAAYPLTLEALRPGMPNDTCPDRRHPFVTRQITSSYEENEAALDVLKQVIDDTIVAGGEAAHWLYDFRDTISDDELLDAHIAGKIASGDLVPDVHPWQILYGGVNRAYLTMLCLEEMFQFIPSMEGEHIVDRISEVAFACDGNLRLTDSYNELNRLFVKGGGTGANVDYNRASRALVSSLAGSMKGVDRSSKDYDQFTLTVDKICQRHSQKGNKLYSQVDFKELLSELKELSEGAKRRASTYNAACMADGRSARRSQGLEVVRRAAPSVSWARDRSAPLRGEMSYYDEGQARRAAAEAAHNEWGGGAYDHWGDQPFAEAHEGDPSVYRIARDGRRASCFDPNCAGEYCAGRAAVCLTSGAIAPNTVVCPACGAWNKQGFSRCVNLLQGCDADPATGHAVDPRSPASIAKARTIVAAVMNARSKRALSQGGKGGGARRLDQSGGARGAFSPGSFGAASS